MRNEFCVYCGKKKKKKKLQYKTYHKRPIIMQGRKLFNSNIKFPVYFCISNGYVYGLLIPYFIIISIRLDSVFMIECRIRLPRLAIPIYFFCLYIYFMNVMISTAKFRLLLLFIHPSFILYFYSKHKLTFFIRLPAISSGAFFCSWIWICCGMDFIHLAVSIFKCYFGLHANII